MISCYSSPRTLVSSLAEMRKEYSPEKQDEAADWLAKALSPWPGLRGLAGNYPAALTMFLQWAKNVQG